MKMEDCLARLGISVYHRAKSRAVDTFLPGHSCRHDQQVPQKSLVQILVIQRRDVLARDNQHVDRRFGIYVLERNALIIFINNRGGFLVSGNLAEYASEHPHYPFFVSIKDRLLDSEGEQRVLPSAQRQATTRRASNALLQPAPP